MRSTLRISQRRRSRCQSASGWCADRQPSRWRWTRRTASGRRAVSSGRWSRPARYSTTSTTWRSCRHSWAVASNSSSDDDRTSWTMTTTAAKLAARRRQTMSTWHVSPVTYYSFFLLCWHNWTLTRGSAITEGTRVSGTLHWRLSKVRQIRRFETFAFTTYIHTYIHTYII